MEIFIGSSSEAIGTAKEVACELENLGHIPRLWNDPENYKFSRYIFDELVEISNIVQAAIFIFANDDEVVPKSVNDSIYRVRDNVMIEFGLFAGKLGLENVAFIQMGGKELHTASDLNGIKYIPSSKYNRNKRIEEWLSAINSDKLKVNNKTMFTNNYDITKDNNVPMNQNVTSTDYNNIPANSHNVNSSYNNGSVNTTATQTNYNSVRPTNSNKSNGGVQFTFYGVSDYASSITEFFVKIVEMIMKKYPDRINDILKNNPMISTTTVGLKYSKNGDVYRKIVINGITYYIGTSTDTNTKKSQLRNIFRSIGINPTMDVITIDGKAL